LIVSSVTATNDYMKDKQFRKLNKMEKDEVVIKVIRDGNEVTIKPEEILVGDVVILAEGDPVPADGFFIDGSDFKTNESAMTGEQEPKRKSLDLDPHMLSGCTVSKGFGTMLVTGVGVNSEWGRTLLKLTEEEEDETPLQEKLSSLAELIGKIGVIFAVLTFQFLTIGWLIAKSKFLNLIKKSNCNIKRRCSMEYFRCK
jgi:P-type Ca2+ transporter type 2C